MDKQERLFRVKRAQERVKAAMIVCAIIAVFLIAILLGFIYANIREYDVVFGAITLVLGIVYISLKQMWFMLEQARENILNNKGE